MINIRYHFITIASIFLALAIGILLGGTAGQSWFTAKEREIFESMEQKYNKTLKSNNELKKQVNQLMMQVEKSNEEVTHLMVTRYANELQGQHVFIWYPDSLNPSLYTRILESVGLHVVHYDPPVTSSNPQKEALLILGKEVPEWIHRLPSGVKWVQVDTMPNTPSKKWKMLEIVQTLLKEKRWENEKS
ncbi:copper transporter [Brevibacillus ginsengisoli]|uniref:copper transporter n=1 Tax=Brevibacillus ginsengisoli TaxID=363854 RepID=UPI003CF1594D